MSEGTCLGVVPLKAGVLGIAAVQFLYEGATVGMRVHSGMESRQMGFYVEFTFHCVNLLAAIMLAVGVCTKTRQMFIPWLLLTVLLPAMFMVNMVSSLLFLQFHAAADLILHQAIPALITFYFCSVVYTLYIEMELNAAGFFIPPETLYGTSNVVFSREPEPLDLPPSYTTAVTAHKEHIENFV
ncbi:uncharacterized protein LOC111698711 [Eurytemora carolleeae]|uniref:uncharacterized protein LOC111698711 n=1 Tax=Eurytemora carolleeae TaxID=1294199 RepID=UPI000C76B69E|nr:uncharacterized protein LOC111698711 [Eurytemora carolleeae]|eukprot:XP_023324887.1 uncharacterized protein LOC111698711 [Eurytemora affinis]